MPAEIPWPKDESEIQRCVTMLMEASGFPEDRRRSVEDDLRKQIRTQQVQQESCRHLRPLQDLEHLRSSATAYLFKARYTCSCTLLGIRPPSSMTTSTSSSMRCNESTARSATAASLVALVPDQAGGCWSPLGSAEGERPQRPHWWLGRATESQRKDRGFKAHPDPAYLSVGGVRFQNQGECFARLPPIGVWVVMEDGGT